MPTPDSPSPPPPHPDHPGHADLADLHDRSEHDLVARLQRGGPADRDAWSQLIQRCQHSVYLTCLRYTNNPDDAADLTQDAFVQAIRHIASFDSRAKLTTWITRIAINLCLSHRRAQRLRRHESLDAPSTSDTANYPSSKPLQHADAPPRSENLGPARTPAGLERTELSASDRVEQSESHAALYAALADLPGEQRALLVLRDVQGLEYEQIAEVLGVALGTVKSRLFRARLALKQAFDLRAANPTSPRPHTQA